MGRIKYKTEAEKKAAGSASKKRYVEKNYLKTKESQKKYKASIKGKLAEKKYRSSDKGRLWFSEHYKSHNESIRNKSSLRYLLNSKDILEKQKQKYKNISHEDLLKKRKNSQNWKKTLKGKASNRKDSSIRRATVKLATPKWNDNKKTKKIYKMAVEIEELFGSPIHVDHVIPIKGIVFEDGSEICGLNVWYNLMPVLEEDNESKRNLCPPLKRIPGLNVPHLNLTDLPEPNNWMMFIESILKAAIVNSKNTHEKKAQMIKKNFIEVNPKKLKI